MSKKLKNKIRTCGYFIKRLKDNGFVVWRVCSIYPETDPRLWTVLVNPGKESIYITCYTNRHFLNEIMFELHDGGNLFPKNYSIKTSSMEVIVNSLLERNVSNAPTILPYSQTNVENLSGAHK